MHTRNLLATAVICSLLGIANSASAAQTCAGATASSRTAAPGESRTPSPPLTVKWESGRLSLDAEGVPLSEVLRAISRETGLEVKSAEGLTDLISIHLEKMELLQALPELLFHVDYAISGGPQGPSSPLGTGLIIIGRTPAAASAGSSPLKAEPTATEQDAQAANQAAAATTAESDAQASAPSAPVSAENVPTPEPPQQIPSQSVPANQQSPAIPPTDNASTNTDSPISADSAQQVDASTDVVGADAPSATFPTTEPLPDPVQEEKMAAVEAAAASRDRAALSQYMQDSNAAVQASAFDALAALNNPEAVEKLLAEINDNAQPSRLQALQVLSQSPQADEQTVMATLLDALNGSDATMSAYAALALAQRGTEQTLNALREMLSSSNASTKVMILQSVAQTDAGLSVLPAALSDPNETVSNVAETPLQQAQATTRP